MPINESKLVVGGEFPKRLLVRIAGVSYHNEDGTSRQQLLLRLQIGERLELVREPLNEFDANAVAVWRLGREPYGKLGYVPAKVAAVLAAQMDEESWSTDFFATVESVQEVIGGPGLSGAAIWIKRQEKPQNERSGLEPSLPNGTTGLEPTISRARR